MKTLIPVLFLTFFVLLGSVGMSWSADFETWKADFLKGLDAADRGDLTTALRDWKPLAK